MSKISYANAILDTSAFVSSSLVNSITLLNSSSIVVGGVTSVIGSSGSDYVSLKIPTGLLPDGFTPANVANFSFDTNTTKASSYDVFVGTAGDDTVTFTNSALPGSVNLQIIPGGGSDSITLTPNNDRVTFGAVYNGNITTNGGVDTIVGSSATDLIVFNSGTFSANVKYSSYGSVADLLSMSTQADVLTLQNTSKLNYYNPGSSDTINGSFGKDEIKILDTVNSPVTVSGNGSADKISLSATAGVADIINYANIGNSTLSAFDTITNFEPGTISTTVDLIQLTGLTQGTFAKVPAGSAFTGDGQNSEFMTLQSGSDTRLFIDTNADSVTDLSILLVGVTPSTLTVADFSLV